MQDSNVSLDLVFNVSKGDLESANATLDSTQDKLSKSTQKTKSFSASVGKLAAGFSVFGLALSGISALKDILTEPIKQSLELNAQYENLSNSLASLISINHENTDSLGNNLSVQEKWQLSLEKSKETIEDLKEVGLKLGYSINDMSDMFKTFYSTAGASMSLEQAKEVMEGIAVAAQVSGSDVESLKVTLDTLGSGAVDTATDFGRFAKSLGLSTEAMSKAKSEGKLYELMLEKLSPLQESIKAQSLSYSVAMGRLNSAFDDIKRNALAPYFEAIKNSIVSLTNILTQNQEKIALWANAVIDSVHRIITPLKELALFIWDTLSEAIQWLASCFRESNKELDSFVILLKTAQSLFVGIGAIVSVIVEAIQVAINALKLLINKAMEGYNAIKLALSFGSDNEAKRNLDSLAKRSEAISADITNNVKDMGGHLVGAYQDIIDIWTKQQEKVEKSIEDTTKKAQLVAIQRKPEIEKKSGKAAGGKSEEERLKAFWDYEYRIRERNIELMQDGKRKELEAEKLRYEKTITNLNFEINEKLKSGEIELSQVNALYAAENALHEQKMKHIQEYNVYAEQTMTSLNYNLSSALQGLMNGGGMHVFENMFKEAQNSITQGFSNALSDAFMNSKVMESMQKSLGSVLEKITGEGGFLDKLFNSNGLGGKISEALGSVMAGFGLGQAAGGLVGSFTSNEENKKQTQLGNTIGSAAGAGIGAIFGPVGSIIGGVAGGILGSLIGSFSSTKTESIGKGVELTQRATKESINAREYEDFKTTKTSWWGLSKKESFHTNFYDANSRALKQIQNTLRAYEYALQDIGGSFASIGVDAGRYSSYADIANAGAKELIANFLDIPKTITEEYTTTSLHRFHIDISKGVQKSIQDSLGENQRLVMAGFTLGSQAIGIVETTLTREIENPDLTAVYKVWEEYAKSVDKEVNEALLESLNSYINTGNNFQTWLYNFRGQESEALKFQAELAKQQVDRLMETLGASDINIDNYLEYREQAIKQSFDPDTIANINALGEALMASSDATKKYEEALKGENKTKLNMIDPFLAKTKKLEEIQQEKDTTQEKLSVQMLATLKQMLRVSQESLNEMEKAK